MTIRPLSWLTQVTASKAAKFEEGLDANSQKITSVGYATASTDGVAYGQLADYSSSAKTHVDAADTTIQTNIDNVSGSVKAYTDAAQSAVQTNLNNMSSSLKTYVDAADASLQNNIDSVSSSLVAYVDAADQVLQTNIDNVSSSLKAYVDAADQAFQTSLDNVSSSMKSYVDARETALQSNIDSVSASLSSSLATEQAARTEQDLLFLKLDGSRTMAGNLNMGSYDITNVVSATFGGDLTVQGILQTNGTVTSLNTANVEVTDKLVTIGKGSANAAAADGAGINVDGADVNLTYDSASNKWVSDIGLSVASEASFDAAIKLSGSAFTNIAVGITSSKFDVSDAIHALDTQNGYITANLSNAYDALRYVVTGTFSVPVDEAAVATVTLPAFFTSSMIDTVSLDILVDQGSGWTNDLVSGKMYPSGSLINVDINAPAAQNGDKYRLIAVANASIFDGVIYNVNNGSAGTNLVGGTIVYHLNEATVGLNIIDSGGNNYNPQWHPNTNMSRIAVDPNGVYGNALKFGGSGFMETAGGGLYEGQLTQYGSPTTNINIVSQMNTNIFTFSCTVDMWIKPIAMASYDAGFFKISGMGYGGSGTGDGMYIGMRNPSQGNDPSLTYIEASCGDPPHGYGVGVDSTSLGNAKVLYNNWTHVAVRKTVTSDPLYQPTGISVTLEIFVNGQKATGATGVHSHYSGGGWFIGNGQFSQEDYLFIGWGSTSRPSFQGSIDDIRISDSALSDGEIYAAYLAGSASLAAGGGLSGPGAFGSPSSSGTGTGGLSGATGNNPTSEWAKKICDNLNPVGGAITFNKGSYWC